MIAGTVSNRRRDPKPVLVQTGRVTAKGQAVIPVQLRGQLKIGPGSTLVWIKAGRALIAVPYDRELARLSREVTEALRGLGLSADLLKAERPAASRRVYRRLYSTKK